MAARWWWTTLAPAVLVTAVVGGAGLVQALRAPPGVAQTVLRIVEEVQAHPERLQFETGSASAKVVLKPLLRDVFPRNTEEWLYLRSSEVHWREEQRPRLRNSSERGEPFVRFTDDSGILVRILPVAPHEVLRFEAVARVQASGPGSAPELSFGVVPLKRAVDLQDVLATRSLAELGHDPGRELLCYGAPPPQIEEGPVPASGDWETLTQAFRTPLDARALLILVTVTGGQAGSADLRSVTLAPVVLRDLLVGEASGERVPPELRVSRSALGLRPLDPESTAPLSQIGCLGETRDGFVLAPPAVVRAGVRLPEGSPRLEFGCCRLFEARESWPAHFIDLRVSVQPDGGPATELLLEPLDPRERRGWKDRTLDLSPWAGQQVTLQWSAETEFSSDLVAVGSPLVRTSGQEDPRPSIVLISLDTVRADHLGAYGYARPTTPFLDELARSGVLCERAYSTSSYTLPAHASLLTGQLPSLHGALSDQAGRNRIVPQRSASLAVLLGREGYLTAAFTGGAYVSPTFGFAHGFDRYSSLDPMLPAAAPLWNDFPVPGAGELNRELRAERGLEDVLDWLTLHRDARFFLFVHTFLVHEYIADPESYAALGLPASDPAEFLRYKVDRRRDPGELAAADLQAGIDAYDAALRQADAAVERIVRLLQAARLWDETILIVTSDHGEEFGEHGRLGHGRTLFEEMIRVPLILHLPGAGGPAVVRTPVSLVDVVPTLLDLLSLEPATPVHGRSVLEELQSEAAPGPVFAELDITADNRWRSAVEGSWKLVERLDQHDPAAPVQDVALYDLTRDASEDRDLSGEQPRRAEELLARLRQALQAAAEARARFESGDLLELAPHDMATLQALGYFK